MTTHTRTIGQFHTIARATLGVTGGGAVKLRSSCATVKRVDSLLIEVATRREEQGRSVFGRSRRAVAHTARRLDAGRRKLPDFLIVGAQKAGTTSLHAYLCEHDLVSAPSTKEVHFFDHAYARGLGWYRAHFERSQEGRVTGESTPYYLFHPGVPSRVASDMPDCRLIVLLRDPIDRAYSHHHHETVLGFEDLSFEEALASEADRLAGEEQRILAEPGYRSFAHQHYSYRARGRYAEQLERWLEFFDRDQILVLAAEDLFAEPGETVSRVQEFIGLPPSRPRDLTAKNARSYAPISATARARLQEEFAPHNARLYELLGRDFGWG
jgi:Sulfotransferase domain